MLQNTFNVRDFGAHGDGVTDDSHAFQRALNAIEALSPFTDVYGTFTDVRGAILEIPFGSYVLTKTLRIRRQMIIQGVSGAGDFAGTRLVFAPDIDGISIERQHSGPLTHSGGAFGDWTVIRDLAVQSDNTHSYANRPLPSINEDEPISASGAHIAHVPIHGHGIVLMGRARVVNCLISGFHYDGIYVDTVDDFKNANNFELQNCRIQGNGRHGVFAAGENSNAGRLIGIDCSGNAGWGIYDRSFLGNTYVGCHCANNGHFATESRCVIVNPNLPAKVYAGTADGGFYFANDGGRHWSAFNRGLSVGGSNASISALALDSSGTRLYLGSSDGGVFWIDPRDGWTSTVTQWTPVNSGLTTKIVHSLALAGDPSLVYAGTETGVFRSLDSGNHWNSVGLSSQIVQVLAINSDDPDHLYAGTAVDGLFETKDGGSTWTARNVGLSNMNVLAIVVEQVNVATVFAGTAGGVFKSIDGGNTWTSSLPSQHAAAIAIDPIDAAIIYAGTNHGVFKSTDGGATWIATSAGLQTTSVRALAIDPSSTKTVYAGAESISGWAPDANTGGVYRSVDGGILWHGGQDTSPSDPENSSRTFYGGGYKTTGNDANNVLVGCYSEADQVNGNELSFPTLVVGGTLGGGFNAITTAGIIDQDGITNLPLRSTVIHATQTLVRKASVSPIAPTSLEAHNIFSGAAVTLVDLTNGSMVLVLSPASTVSGQQFVVRRIDSALTPAPFEVWIKSIVGDPIDTGSQIILDLPNTGVILLSDGAAYRIIGQVGGIKLS
jgi:photosystem II stability/assembly factor-like uncharacterized protein